MEQKFKVTYTKRMNQDNWQHGSRTLKAFSAMEAKLSVLFDLLAEGCNVLCISTYSTYFVTPSPVPKTPIKTSNTRADSREIYTKSSPAKKYHERVVSTRPC